MNLSIFVGLLQNIAILLSFALLYDYVWVKNKSKRNIINKIITGIICGGLGLLLMITPWTFISGIVFDSRSILLSITGLFFGPIPTLTAMIITSIYRIYLGGDGMVMGLAVIISSGTTGIIWNVLRHKARREFRLIDLYLLGLIVHFLMLCCILFVPTYLQFITFKEIVIPTIIIYPLGTMLLGYLLVSRIKHWDTEKALKASEEKYKLLHEYAGVGIGYYSPEGIVLSFNELAVKYLRGKPEDFEGKSVYEIFPKEEADIYMKRISVALNSDEKLEYEDLLTLSTRNIWLLRVFTCVKDPEDNLIGVQIISQDITQRKETEIKLKNKMIELERFNEITVGRELKMVELKEEINALLKRLGENEKYKIVK